MCLSSGDHDGYASAPELVSVVSPVPSGLTRTMFEKVDLTRMKTRGWVGSGERPGPVPSLQPIEIAAAAPNVAPAR